MAERGLVLVTRDRLHEGPNARAHESLGHVVQSNGPAHALDEQLISRVDALVEEVVVDVCDGFAVATQPAIERDARIELDAGKLSESDAQLLSERVPPEDQSTVIGVGGSSASSRCSRAARSGSAPSPRC